MRTSSGPPRHLMELDEVLSLDGVSIRRPRRDEFALLIELRNRERQWFGDQGELDPAAAEAWLALRHEDDQLLCIESGGMVVGTIGWVRVPVPGRIYEIGRVIGDYRALRRNATGLNRMRTAVQSAILLASDHLFGTLRAEAVYARNRPANGLVRRSIIGFEGKRGAWPFPTPDQGMECWHVDAVDWAEVRAKVLARIDAEATVQAILPA